MTTTQPSRILLSWLQLSSFTVALLPHTKINRIIPPSRAHTFSMYFDDVSRSRYTVPWNQDDSQTNLNFSSARGGRGGFRTNANGDQMKNYSEQKLDALYKSLYGYDPKIASRLSVDEVEKDVRYWYENSDIGVNFFQARDFESSNNIIVCTEKDATACMSFMWQCIDIYTKNLEKNNDIHRETTTIVFPRCTSLYNYYAMERWFNLLERCGEVCSVFTKHYGISHFHPTYKNEPKMLSLIRHAPFPSFVLHGKRAKSIARQEISPLDDESQIDYIFGKVFNDDGTNRVERGKESDDMEENVDSLFHDYIDQRRNDFEVLFNSDAAVSPLEGEVHVGVNRNAAHFSENKSIESQNSDDVVIAMTKDWMNKSKIDKEGNLNKALQYSGSISNRWVLTNSTSEEDLYKQVWSAIDELQNHDCKSFPEDTSVISTIFVPRNYSTFNANQFKRFAISINGILKELTGGRIFLELFHPEYVAKKSCQSKLRRSPFPTLQICRRLHDGVQKADSATYCK